MEILHKIHYYGTHTTEERYVSDELFGWCMNCENCTIYLDFPKCSEAEYTYICLKYVGDTVPCPNYKLMKPFSDM